jgi:hypothetical protein
MDNIPTPTDANGRVCGAAAAMGPDEPIRAMKAAPIQSHAGCAARSGHLWPEPHRRSDPPGFGTNPFVVFRVSSAASNVPAHFNISPYTYFLRDHASFPETNMHCNYCNHPCELHDVGRGCLAKHASGGPCGCRNLCMTLTGTSSSTDWRSALDPMREVPLAPRPKHQGPSRLVIRGQLV